MSICMIGIDHTKASIDVRTIFSFTKKSASETLARWKDLPEIQGCIIISTCNRMEVWASVDSSEYDLFELLCKEKGVDPEQYREYLIFRKEKAAAWHLFELSCGLQSRILGEDQIITQVKDALTLAREQFATDNVLEVLFRMAVTAAKRVKTEVVLSSSNHSAIDQAIASLKKQGHILENKTCMVIGNGEMGKLSANAFKREGANVTVTVRQYRSGVVQIPLGCERIDYGNRMELFPQCDYVVSATTSPNYTLTKALLESVTIDHPVTMIDLAVPRDIEPSVAELTNVDLYDIDSFDADRTSEQTKAGIAQAEEILRSQMLEFFDWYQGRDIMDTIQQIKEKTMEDFHLRTVKQMKTLCPPEASEEERRNLIKVQAYIDQAEGKIINKLIFGLKSHVSDEVFRECIAAIGEVFQS